MTESQTGAGGAQSAGCSEEKKSRAQSSEGAHRSWGGTGAGLGTGLCPLAGMGGHHPRPLPWQPGGQEGWGCYRAPGFAATPGGGGCWKAFARGKVWRKAMQRNRNTWLLPEEERLGRRISAWEGAGGVGIGHGSVKLCVDRDIEHGTISPFGCKSLQKLAVWVLDRREHSVKLPGSTFCTSRGLTKS